MCANSRLRGMRLKRYLRKGKDPVTINRAHVALAGAQGMRVPEIARRYHYSREGDALHDPPLQRGGPRGIFPRYAGGMALHLEEQKTRIMEIALSKLADLGCPSPRGSLSKLQEWIRRILLGGASYLPAPPRPGCSQGWGYEFKKTGF